MSFLSDIRPVNISHLRSGRRRMNIYSDPGFLRVSKHNSNFRITASKCMPLACSLIDENVILFCGIQLGNMYSEIRI